MVRRWIRWMARNKTSFGQMTTIELPDARREPDPAGSIADKQHGGTAGGRRWRRRRQHVVDLEVPVRCERNRVGIAFDEGGDVFTNECREDMEAGRRSTGGCQHERAPDGVARGKHEASPVDGDAPVVLHLGLQLGDDPTLGGLNPSDDVAGDDVRGSGRPWGIRDWVYPDSTVELDERVVGPGERQRECERDNHE